MPDDICHIMAWRPVPRGFTDRSYFFFPLAPFLPFFSAFFLTSTCTFQADWIAARRERKGGQ